MCVHRRSAVFSGFVGLRRLVCRPQRPFHTEGNSSSALHDIRHAQCRLVAVPVSGRGCLCRPLPLYLQTVDVSLWLVCESFEAGGILGVFVCRISKEKWPKQRFIQWLESLPSENPAAIRAQQPEASIVNKWRIHAEKHKEYVIVRFTW